MVVKIIKTTKNDTITFQVVDEAYEDIPENRGKPFPTALEAVNAWLYPNNDESGVAKFLAEVPIVEDEPTPEPIVGEIPQGNIINMVMGKNFMRPDTHHDLVNWALSVLGFDNDDCNNCTPEEFAPKVYQRVDLIHEPLLLLKICEVAKEGIRGCRNDAMNDSVSKIIQDACMSKLGNYIDELPPSLWHKVHMHELWSGSDQTESISLPTPKGWAEIHGIRPEKSGGWQVSMKLGDETFTSPQYVLKMGLKARHDGYAKGSHSGVQCQAYHLFNADGMMWGFEVYLISPKKTVGCEVKLDGTFSLFRSGVYLPPRTIGYVRQGDALFRRLDIQKEDVKIGETDHLIEMRSVAVSDTSHKIVSLDVLVPQEHKHKGYDYWHPISRIHSDVSILTIQNEETRLEGGIPSHYDGILILNEDAILTHPDHPSIALTAGYYQVLPVEGETDYQPRQRRGD